MKCPPPGPRSRAWLARHGAVNAPMGPRVPVDTPPSGIVFAHARGANLFDSDGNRYVDLAGGFGALLLGHSHPEIAAAVARQSSELLQAMGDVYPSETKVALLERLTGLYPRRARALLAQSGSDAISAALKTAALFTGRPGIVAFSGAYHGLGYGPLAALGLRPSYREPFRDQLNAHVTFVEYPGDVAALDEVLRGMRAALATNQVGAVLVEPILGRGGVLVPPMGFLSALQGLAHEHGALLVADEVWTGLGRSGALLYSTAEAVPDLICLGKGLGGGVPISALIGRSEVLDCWSRDDEVVHTSTYAGAPLACAAALATLNVLERECLARRSRELGERFRVQLREALAAASIGAAVRGQGLMIGVELASPAGAPARGAGIAVQRALLERGYISSTGGGKRDVLVLTPPLNIDESLLFGFIPELVRALRESRDA